MSDVNDDDGDDANDSIQCELMKSACCHTHTYVRDDDERRTRVSSVDDDDGEGVECRRVLLCGDARYLVMTA